MRKYIFITIFCAFILAPYQLSAETDVFPFSLGYGSSETTHIYTLQKFLFNEGFLTVTPTGKYLSLTQQAVRAFQKSQNIDQTGYFGPISRAAANKKLAVVSGSSQSAASVSIKSVTPNNSLSATVLLSGSKKIHWQTSGYPQDAGVNINLLRKTTASPAVYEFVRSIAQNTANDGEETWTPRSDEKSSDLYIEVTCATTYTFTGGCQISQNPIKVQ